MCSDTHCINSLLPVTNGLFTASETENTITNNLTNSLVF